MFFFLLKYNKSKTAGTNTPPWIDKPPSQIAYQRDNDSLLIAVSIIQNNLAPIMAEGMVMMIIVSKTSIGYLFYIKKYNTENIEAIIPTNIVKG